MFKQKELSLKFMKHTYQYYKGLREDGFDTEDESQRVMYPLCTI